MQNDKDHSAETRGGRERYHGRSATETASISIEKLKSAWDGDPPSYIVSDDREGVCLCACWLPDVAERIRSLLAAETIPVVVVYPTGQHQEVDLPGVVGPNLNRVIGPEGREWFFDKAGYYDGWGQSLAATQATTEVSSTPAASPAPK